MNSIPYLVAGSFTVFVAIGMVIKFTYYLIHNVLGII